MINCEPGALNPGSARFCSDCRIIRVPFTGSVKLRSILLKAGPGDQTPSRVSLVGATVTPFAMNVDTEKQLVRKLWSPRLWRCFEHSTSPRIFHCTEPWNRRLCCQVQISSFPVFVTLTVDPIHKGSQIFQRLLRNLVLSFFSRGGFNPAVLSRISGTLFRTQGSTHCYHLWGPGKSRWSSKNTRYGYDWYTYRIWW